jgi:hypothetical protein
VNVAIYGATGWTGRLVAAALSARRIDVVLIGRRADALARLAQHIPGATWIAASDGPSLARALEDTQVVVNCAGPSEDGGIAVVDAAIAACTDYLDVSGEETFVRRVYGSRDAGAHDAGVVIAPAFAGKGALGDWGASLLVAELGTAFAGSATDISIAYAHTSLGFLRPSRGSALAAASQQFLRLRDRRRAPPMREFDFPRPFGHGRAIRVPGTEDVSIATHQPVAETATYIAIDPGGPTNRLWCELILGAAPLMPAIAAAMQSPIGRRLLGAGLEPLASRQPTFGAAIEARRFGETRQMAIVASDAYTVTAAIVALGAERMLRRDRGLSGVLAPSRLCDPANALAELQSLGALYCLRHDHR